MKSVKCSMVWRVRTDSLVKRARRAAPVACVCLIICAAGARVAAGQAVPVATANQLHAAIENGDVDALRYWVSDRHADPNAPNAREPDLTPLARCLQLAARLLDGPSSAQMAASSGGASSAAPVIGLRVLQEMVALLDEHGARLADAEKRRFSAPVLRWYADAVSRPDPKTNAGPNTIGEAPVTTTPVNSPAAPPPRPAAKPEPASPETRSGANAPATPAPTSPTPPEPEPPARPPKPALVVIAPDLRKACNGTGRRVFLLNKTDMSITATVTIARDAPGESKPPSGSSSYVVAPGGSWELGCTASPDGGAVRYELNYWK